MRGVPVSSVAFGVLAGAACTLQALPSPSLQGDSSAPAISGLNSANSADRALQAFDEAHPQCQLWTNWQKMCSRTGPAGETYCVTDADRSVRPSEPFCTATTAGAALPPSTSRQRASYGRFCRVQRDQGSDQFRGCEGSDDRPFNGRRIAARLHPWCDLWVDADYRPVCQSGDLAMPNVPRCEALARDGFEARSKLVCARRTTPQWCRTSGLLGSGPQYPFTTEYLPLGSTIGNATVVGTYCREPR